MKAFNTVLLRSMLGLCAVAALASTSVRAASINYGDFSAATIDYQQVTESSVTDPVPLFNAPSTVGDRLDFDPTSFGAVAVGGAADATDGQLNFKFDTAFGKGVTSFQVIEGGDYTLFGAGTAATSLAYGLFAKVTVLEVNGVPVTPFDVSGSTSMLLDLVANAGVSQPWGRGLLLDLGPALALNGFAGKAVSKGEFVLNNTLVATSERGTVAFLAKKDIYIDTTTVETDEVIPEPATALLGCVALAGLGLSRRR